MLPGCLTTACPGEVQDLFRIWDVLPASDGTGARLKAALVAGAGDRWFALVCEEKLRDLIYIPEGAEVTLQMPWDPYRIDHPVSLVDCGDWDSLTEYDPAEEQRAFEEDKAASLELVWDAQLELAQAWNDEAQLSSWSLTGLERFTNCRPVAGVPTAARLDLRIADSAGTRTVQLLVGGRIVASGSRSGDGSITLAEQNDSGLSGSVTIAYSADVDADAEAFLEVRWAASYKLYVSTSLSFPRDADMSIADRGLGGRLRAVYGPLPAGTYEYLLRAVSDTGAEGTATSPMGSKAVPGRPEPPGDPVYASGGYADTVLEFTPSPTPGATYRVYDAQELDWSTDFENIAATHAAGSGTLDVTLPAIAAAAGKRRVVVESVLDGVESGARKHVTIEYAADGSVVDPRPNAPAWLVLTRSGLDLTVRVLYDGAEELGVGAEAQVWLLAEGAAIPADGATPDATEALDGEGTSLSAEVTVTAGAAGLYRVLVRVADSGGTQSRNDTPTGPYYLSDAAPSAPGNVSAEVLA